MLRKKRALALVVGAALAITPFNVYAEDSGEKVVLQWQAAYLSETAVDKYIEEYNASQDKVVVEKVDTAYGSTAEYFEALAINVASGEAADIFSMSPAYFDKYVQSQVAYCVDDYILNNDDVKDYAKQAVSRNGHAYAFPATNDIIGLYVNLDLLEKSGHTVDDLKYWDGMLTAAADIAKENDCYGCLTNLGFGGAYAEYLWYSDMWSAGGDISADVDGNITVTNPEGIAKAGMMYHDLITGEAGSTEFNNDIDYFINQVCGMVITGQTGLRDIEKAEPEFEWTFVPLPAAEGGKSYATLGGWNTMINGQSEHAEEAAEFVRWLYFDSDYISDFCMDFFQLSPLKSADEKLDALYVDTLFKIAYDYIEAGDITCKAEIALDSQVLEAVGEMLSGMVYEATSEEEALTYVQGFIDKVGATVAE